MKVLTWPEIWALKEALSDLTNYVSDNSCGDPECCGGPYYEKDDFDRASELLASYGLRWNGTTE